MDISSQERALSIRTSQIEPGNLMEVLEEVGSALPEDIAFCYLMADFWNCEGYMAYYPEGIKNLYKRSTDCIGGSAFGQEAELRWRRVNGRLKVVVIAEANLSKLSPPDWVDEEYEVRRCVDRKRLRVLLWGTKHLRGRKWVEARIPRILSYPADPMLDSDFQHVWLHFVEYRDKRGRPVIHRRTHISAHIERLTHPAGIEQKGGESVGE